MAKDPHYTPEPVAEPEPEPKSLPVDRLVKLADESTIYLVKDKSLHPIVNAATAVALGLPVEVVTTEELAEWRMGAAI